MITIYSLTISASFRLDDNHKERQHFSTNFTNRDHAMKEMEQWTERFCNKMKDAEGFTCERYDNTMDIYTDKKGFCHIYLCEHQLMNEDDSNSTIVALPGEILKEQHGIAFRLSSAAIQRGDKTGFSFAECVDMNTGEYLGGGYPYAVESMQLYPMTTEERIQYQDALENQFSKIRESLLQ